MKSELISNQSITKEDDIDELAIEEIAKKYNISKVVVKQICRFPFKFIKKMIIDHTFDHNHVLLNNFGKFVINDYKRQCINKRKELKKIQNSILSGENKLEQKIDL
jgi:nucleoid DNA-binding protein